MTSFRARIRRAIADPVLQAALDANAQRRVEARRRALASLPDYEARREQARAIRAAALADWDGLLERFLARVAANGIHVHRAADAAQARALALEIVSRAAPQALVAKSKSMVSEEIGLNAALEAAGHRVVETDLGEYIVQLRGERPSHIITPAVHLRRQEVARLFEQALGLPYTEDVAALTAAAQKALRRVFLRAEVGVSGVNFGVAESGTLCLVTNEGNGRMVTTLPRVHIALMGAERLLPGLDDLALMLSLLPRSATGQKISVYTQFIQRPLPGQERHLILLDNGRRALGASPLADALTCIRCGACLNACPAFREIGGHAYDSVYPGPIGALVSPGLFGPRYQELAYACSLCGACAEVCPVKMPLPDLLVRVRAGQLPQSAPQGGPLPAALRWGLRLFSRTARHPRLYRWGQRAAGALGSRRAAWRLPAWTGWGLGRDLPAPARRPFQDEWSRLEQRAAARPSAGRRPAAPSEAAPPQEAPPAARFRREWEALGGQLIPVRAADLPAALTDWLREHRAGAVHVTAAARRWLPDEVPFRLTQEADPSLRFGLTTALAAVAETGSLLLTGADRDALSASLLPRVHLAVLHADDILPTLAEALALPAWRAAPAAVLVSGPSRTADIEMTLTIGVHGPEKVVVFLVDAPQPL